MSNPHHDDDDDEKSIDDKTQEIIDMLKEAGVSTETLAEDHAFWDTQVRTLQVVAGDVEEMFDFPFFWFDLFSLKSNPPKRLVLTRIIPSPPRNDTLNTTQSLNGIVDHNTADAP